MSKVDEILIALGMRKKSPVLPQSGVYMPEGLHSQIRRFEIDPKNWKSIEATMDCSNYVILGTDDNSAFLRCTDPADATTAVVIPAGAGHAVLHPHPHPHTIRFANATASASVSRTRFVVFARRPSQCIFSPELIPHIRAGFVETSRPESSGRASAGFAGSGDER